MRPQALLQHSPPSMSPDLDTALWGFAPISLGEMNTVSLMRRIDTKFVIHQNQLPVVLRAVQDRYAILEINHQRAMRYHSQYFDTATCRFFIDHHNGKARRAKVRIRSYVDSDISFLEIKLKNAKGVTSKHRIPIEPTERAWTADARDFLTRTIPGTGALHRTVRNHFRRMTLVDTERSERVTVDWDLSSCLDDCELQHRNLVVIEVKQEGLDRHAPIMTALKALGARPYRVSKYCLGMTCLCPDLKSNRFKSRMLHIEKVTAESYN